MNAARPLCRRRATVAMGALLVLLWMSQGHARAHNGEIPPPPPRPPAGVADVKGKSIPPPRWSWLHWWEANREPYLVSPSQSRERQAPDPAQLEALRYDAAKALVAALDAPGRDVVAIESAMALGKLRHTPVLNQLKQLVARGDTIKVRRAALLAIGLLGSEAAENELRAFNGTKLDERTAGLVAIGLLPKVQSVTVRDLQSVLDRNAAVIAGFRDGAPSAESSIVAGTASAWALRQHVQRDDAGYFRTLVRNSENAWIASEALLALGATKDREAVRTLEETLFGNGSEVKAFEALENLNQLKRDTIAQGPERKRKGDQRYDDYLRSHEIYLKRHELYWKNNPNVARPTAESARPAPPDVTYEIGYEVVCMAWLRTSAAIALGRVNEPRAGSALLSFVKEDVRKNEYLVTPQSFAAISLASHPSDAARDRLIELLGKQDEPGKLHLDAPKDSPIRGFAAISLGLYARPYDTPQGPADRAGYDRAVLTLAERLEDDREEEEVRTACAVALGLSQRTSVLPVFHRLTAKIEQRNRRADSAIYGFLLLGRSMAGDQNLIEPAAKFLLDREDDTTTSGILSRRAAALALGVTRSALAIPVLTKAWHLNHYVNREVIVALRLVGGAGAASPVMDRLRQSKDNEERAYMAHALGELLAVEQPTTLNRLIAGSNFTVRNDNLLPLQSLANGFLFDYLIANIGEDW